MIPSPPRVGTAGWSVPSRYAAAMPSGGSNLERYARRLNAVEINSSFYRPHRRTTDGFFRDLRARIDAPVAFEPRNASWFTPDVDIWLAERRIARVAADPATVIAAGEPGGWRGLAYFRWHGAPRMYFSDYEPAALASLKRRLDEPRAHGIPTWCIFDNTGSGAALGNALALAPTLA